MVWSYETNQKLNKIKAGQINIFIIKWALVLPGDNRQPFPN